MVFRPTIKIRTRQIVVQETSMKPYVGFEHPTDVPDGFQYDAKRWSSLFDLRLPTMPRLANSSTQGVSESEYFVSGVGSKNLNDLKLQKLLELSQNNERHWVPYIYHGTYFRYKTDYYYYSDDSRVQYLDPSSNRASRNYIELDKEPDRVSPIMAASFKRHPTTKIPEYHIKINQTYKFTGKYSNGTELETVTPVGKINWNNVDTTKREFVVDNRIDGLTRLFFNRDYIQSHGIVPQVYQDLAVGELVGTSTGKSYQVFYLNYFPVLVDSTFHLYVVNNNSWEEWTRVDSWWDLINNTIAYPNNKKYFLDKDLGIIYFGSTTLGGIPPVGSSLVASYRETIRIEYEELDKEKYIKAWDADTNPVSQSINQGFVCITHSQLEPTNITLSINKSAVAGTLDPKEYGPITVGSDYALLKATVTGIDGIPIPKVEVGFTMTPSDLGYLQGSSSASSITNGTGQAFTSYQPPTSGDSLGFYSTTVRDSTNPYYPGDREVILKVPEAGLTGRESEIYLYQILKDDVLLGYDSIDAFLQNLYQETTPSWVVDATTYAQWKEEMITQWDLKDWQVPVENEPISGRKVVVYQISGTDNTDAYAIHPVTGQLGAVVPLRPYLAEKITTVGDAYTGYWRLIYPAGSIPNIGTADVGGYWAASSRLVEFQAHCWSPYHNRIIYSNIITARITLPSYLLGEYLNSTGQKIPFGWKIKTDTDNVAGGLNGATFITINPHHGPYPVLDLVGGTGETGDWASAPYRTLGFQFKLI